MHGVAVETREAVTRVQEHRGDHLKHEPLRKQKLWSSSMSGEMNGFHNGFTDEDCFLFTSESVGEGHPGKLLITSLESCTTTLCSGSL